MKPLFLLPLLPTLVLAATPPDLTSPLPTPLGVNIHFTDPRPGELDMLSAAGFRFIRMDLSWSRTEPAKGTYDFSPYDRLLASLDRHHIRAILILDYSNPHYDAGLSPHTPDGRRAFAVWAAAAAKHFAGRGVLWEMYNEPNIGFWKPHPSTPDYIALATETAKALKQVDPTAIFVGPASSTIALPFLEECFRAGLLDHFDAVTVHPYRQSAPETAAADYRALRTLIARYKLRPSATGNSQLATGNSLPPILSGEWGYSTVWKSVPPDVQGKYLPRQFLSNLASDVPLSIWYDWHDDGPDPAEGEHHFGTVTHDYHAGRTPPYDPKPSYLAMQTLTHELSGYHFNKRIPLNSPEDFLLLFSKEDALKLVSWTTAAKPKEVDTPFGKLTLTDTPAYAATDSDLARIVAAWDRAPLELFTRGSDRPHLTLTARNPLPRPVTMNGQSVPPGSSIATPVDAHPTLSDCPTPVTVKLNIDGLGTLTQETAVVSLTPITATPLPRAGDVLPVRLDNPAGEPFTGQLHLNGATLPLTLSAGQTTLTLGMFLPLPHPPGPDYTVTLSLTDPAGTLLSGGTPQHFTSLPLAADVFKAIPDGDPKIASDQSLASADTVPPGIPQGATAVRVSYRFDEGWKFLRLDPTKPIDLPGHPASLGLWVHSDASGNQLRCRFTDSAGQTFQPDGVSLTWSGWRYVTLPLDRLHSSNWGGPADGRIHYPIRLTTLALIDSSSRHATRGAILFSSPTITYGPDEPDWVSAPASAQ